MSDGERMNFCLSDLVPPLRWSDAALIRPLTEQRGLPDAWWRSLPLHRVLAVIDAEALGELLTDLALSHWPAAAVGDVLPALHVLDPDDADDPQVAIALDRAGSWPGLLALSGRELADQPFVKARPVLTALFGAVFVRLSPPVAHRSHPYGGAPQRAGGVPAVGALGAVGPGDAGEPLERAEPAGAGLEGLEPAEAPSGDVVLAEAALAATLERDGDAGDDAPDAVADSVAEDFTDDADAAGEHESAEDDAEAVADADADAEDMDDADYAEDGKFAEDAIAEDDSDAGDEEDESAEDDDAGDEDYEDYEADEADEADEDSAEDDIGEADDDIAEDEATADDQDDAYERDDAYEQDDVEDSGDDFREEQGGVAAGFGEPDLEAASPNGGVPGAVPAVVPEPPAGYDFPALIDAAFADLDDQTWMVAQNRVFTEAPSAVQELAKLLAVSPEAIHQLESGLRTRLVGWLTLPEAAPYITHLAWLADRLGTAAPKALLVEAAEWHRRELRSLEVPAWQFVVATLPGYRVSGDWLVAGDVEELRERTRDLIAGTERPPTVRQALEMVVSLGVRPEVARQWLESVPQLRVRSGLNGAHPPSADAEPQEPQARAAWKEPGPPGGQTPGGQAPGGQAPGGQAPGGQKGQPERHQGQLKDVALTRRCFRQPDGRWWLRVDVTGAHLDGGEVSLPTGFAAYVGLTPGDSRTVRSAAGDVALAWHARPVLGSLRQILTEVAAKEGSHIFLTLSEEGMLRVRHLPAAEGGDPTSLALRLVGYTAPGGTEDQAVRVIATRIGLAGPVSRPELLARLRERGDRDLLSLLG
ncbi:hypothetical protein [Microbispora sp. NPDC049125]|uniref:hypothetical protein n=1 Tax=Microbispora sp. NPDC049125 TaxID=3154929 RepID=UPI003467385E